MDARVWLSACLTAATATTCAGEEAFLLQYRFQPGQFLYYDTTQSMTLETIVRDSRETIKNSSRSRKHYRIIAIDADGIALAELVLDEVAMKARFGGGKPIEFDSTSKKRVPTRFRALKQSLGKPQARVKLAPNGKVIRYRPIVRVDEDSDQKNRSSNAFRTVSASNSESSTFDAQTAFSEARSPLIVLPKTRIKVGETWSEVFTVPVMKKVFGKHRVRDSVKLARRYQLTRVEKGIATLKYITSPLTPVRDPSVRAQLLRQMPTGTVTFDIARGALLSKRQEVDNRVVGQFGAKSTVWVKGQHIERLIAGRQPTAKKTGAGEFKKKALGSP